jgi:hypothetical protein
MNVDAIGELLDLRTEILSACGTDERTRGKNRQRSRLCSHDFLPFENSDVSASLPQMAGPKGDAQAWPSGVRQIGLAQRKPA